VSSYISIYKLSVRIIKKVGADEKQRRNKRETEEKKRRETKEKQKRNRRETEEKQKRNKI